MTTVVPTRAHGRLIHLALLFGTLAFAVVVLFLTQTQEPLMPEPVPGLGWAAVAVSGVSFATALAMRAVMRRRAAAATGAERAQLCLVAMLVPVALLEGAILFDCVVWLLEGTPAPYAAMAGFLWLVAAAMPMPAPDDLDG